MPDGRAALLGTVSERELQAHLVAVARREGWRVYFVWDSRHSPAGWPDLALVRGGTLLFLEVKSETGRLTPAQEDCLAALGSVDTVLLDVARPSNVEKIEAMLAAGGRPYVKGD